MSFKTLKVNKGAVEPLTFLLDYFAHIGNDKHLKERLLPNSEVMALDGAPNHMSMPLECLLPSLDESLLHVSLRVNLADLSDSFGSFKLVLDTFEGETLLCLVHRHSELDQSLNLARQQLVAHIRLVGDNFLSQRSCHLDAIILQENLGGSIGSLDHLFFREFLLLSRLLFTKS